MPLSREYANPRNIGFPNNFKKMDGIPIIKKDAEFPGQYTDVLMQVLSFFAGQYGRPPRLYRVLWKAKDMFFFEVQYIDMDPFCMSKMDFVANPDKQTSQNPAKSRV